MTKNFPQGTSTTVTLENTSPLYCFINNEWNLCSNCDINPSVVVAWTDSAASNAKNWTICSDDPFNDCYIDNYGYGLYKISESFLGNYFYIDFRDCDYTPGYPGYLVDVKLIIDYYSGNGKFYYYITHDPSDKIEISHQQLLTIREIHSQSGDMNTSCFPDLWENCLGITVNGNNPQLIYFEHPTASLLGYRIYRATCDYSHTNPEQLNYTLIDSTSSSTYNYIDYSVNINGSDFFYYFVKGYWGRFHQYETTRTNIVEIEGGLYKKSESVLNKTFSQDLLQNSPNPFNPSTVISYQLASDSYITLKVFDLLGREITTLAEGIKPAGKYEEIFHAQDLPSGTYIYTLNINGNVNSKKMQLLK